MDIFKQPQAAATMHLGQVKTHMSLLTISKLDKFLCNLAIVKKTEFISRYSFVLSAAGLIVEVIIYATIILN